jgi:GTP-binding protein
LPRVVEASFLAAAAGPASMLPPTLAEVAFAGRSNVGKSSLLNALLERRNLVRASATPGTTRQINFFLARASDGLALHMIDLPGYGFARRSKGERRAWGDLIEGYLRTRVTLRALVLIVDVRRGVEDDDRELIEFVASTESASHRAPRTVLVATKLDKLAGAAKKPAVMKLGRAAKMRAIGFSAKTGEGREELWRALRGAVLGADRDERPGA